MHRALGPRREGVGRGSRRYSQGPSWQPVHRPTGRAGSLPPPTECTLDAGRAHADPRESPDLQNRLPARVERRRGSQTGYTRNPASQSLSPPPPASTADTSARRGREGIPKDARPKRTLQSCLPPSPLRGCGRGSRGGSRQRGRGPAGLPAWESGGPSGRSAPSRPKRGRAPANSGPPHCGEEGRASAG